MSDVFSNDALRVVREGIRSMMNDVSDHVSDSGHYFPVLRK